MAFKRILLIISISVFSIVCSAADGMEPAFQEVQSLLIQADELFFNSTSKGQKAVIERKKSVVRVQVQPLNVISIRHVEDHKNSLLQSEELLNEANTKLNALIRDDFQMTSRSRGYRGHSNKDKIEFFEKWIEASRQLHISQKTIVRLQSAETTVDISMVNLEYAKNAFANANSLNPIYVFHELSLIWGADLALKTLKNIAPFLAMENESFDIYLKEILHKLLKTYSVEDDSGKLRKFLQWIQNSSWVNDYIRLLSYAAHGKHFGLNLNLKKEKDLLAIIKGLQERRSVGSHLLTKFSVSEINESFHDISGVFQRSSDLLASESRKITVRNNPPASSAVSNRVAGDGVPKKYQNNIVSFIRECKTIFQKH